MSLGPAVPAACKHCGKKIGVPYLSMLAIAPFIGSIYLATELDSAAMKTGIIILGFLAYSVLHTKLVPLKAR